MKKIILLSALGFGIIGSVGVANARLIGQSKSVVSSLNYDDEEPSPDPRDEDGTTRVTTRTTARTTRTLTTGFAPLYAVK